MMKLKRRYWRSVGAVLENAIITWTSMMPNGTNKKANLQTGLLYEGDVGKIDFY